MICKSFVDTALVLLAKDFVREIPPEIAQAYIISGFATPFSIFGLS